MPGLYMIAFSTSWMAFFLCGNVDCCVVGNADRGALTPCAPFPLPPQAVDMAVRLMLCGETSLVTCSWEKAFHREADAPEVRAMRAWEIAY